MKQSRLLAGLVVLIVLFGGFIFWRGYHPAANTTPSATQQASEITYQGKEGKNALDLLTASHQVEFKQYDFGKMVTSIDGKAADNQHYWAFYVNGEPSQTGADSYLTKDTDSLSWRYAAL